MTLNHTQPVGAAGSLRDQILDISRHNQIGDLSPFFSAGLDIAISEGRFLPEHSLRLLAHSLVHRLTSYRLENNLTTVVIGMSGGVDSALTAALAKQAGFRVIGVTMPIHQNPVETQRGVEACEALGIEHLHKDLSEAFDMMVQEMKAVDSGIDYLTESKAVKIRRGNIRARLRMMTLYNLASLHGGFVLSTDNFSELTAGFWTLHGDVGDVSPIQSLWKSWEVPMLAKIVGVPESTWRATPTDGLGIDAGDEAQLGCSYLEWDLLVMTLSGLALSGQDISTPKIVEALPGASGTDFPKINSFIGRVGASWFKRKNPLNFDHPLEPGRLGLAGVLDDAFTPESARD